MISCHVAMIEQQHGNLATKHSVSQTNKFLIIFITVGVA